MDRRFALLPLVLLAAGCASLERDGVAAPADGGSVELRSGSPLVVSLPPDPSNGYGWVLVSATPNLSLIGGPDYTPAPKPPGLLGVGDTTAFRFRAGEPGPGALEFTWAAPPGQPPVSPARTVRYEVKVSPALRTSYRDFLGKEAQTTVKYWVF